MMGVRAQGGREGRMVARLSTRPGEQIRVTKTQHHPQTSSHGVIKHADTSQEVGDTAGGGWERRAGVS